MSMASAGVAAKILARCDALAQFTERPGLIQRTFLSPPMHGCHRLIAEWMAAAGMTVTVDAAGNLRALYTACGVSGRRIIIGSHLDTVPDAGRYDGILGVVLAIALVESFEGRRPAFDIEVIGFSEEE